MSKAVKKLKKLRGRSLEELRVRGAQAAAAYGERLGLSAQSRLPDDAAFFKMLDRSQLGSGEVTAESLLENFRTRTTPKFFAGFDTTEDAYAEALGRFGAQAEESVVERANGIVEGRFNLLGFRDLNFGTPVDWHLEPVSGKRVPLLHWSRINYLDAAVAGDKKIIWELNRHQYFAALGRAYRQTKNELYAQAFARHISAWMDENPPKLGVNWASSLEISFRAISWLWALYFFKESPSLTPQLALRVLKFLYLHARHLETYLSTYFAPNTHLTGEALGLFYLGTLLPELGASAVRWRETARRILLSELGRHVLPDGLYFEQSSYYHRYTTDFYTHLYILSRRNGLEVESKLEEKLKALLDYLMYVRRPDGTTPLLGDDDGGRLLMLDERAANDFRAPLSTGAALFARPDYKYAAGGIAEETFWLLGGDGLSAFDRLSARPPESTSRAFAEGGYYVMRDGWVSESNYLLIDCGPHGAVNGVHAHADALAFDMASHGRALLVDTGTYTYTGSSEMRDYFRSSAAHNTLTIDGESSSVPEGPFSWKHVAQCRVDKWMSHERFDFFEGEHDGYMRLAAPAKHARSVLFLKGDYFILRDRVMTDGPHRYDLHFHFSADAEPSIEASGDVPAVRERKSGSAGLELFTFSEGGEWRKESGWVSDCYGSRKAAPVLRFEKTGTGPQEFISLLVPRRAAQVSVSVREITAGVGRAFELKCGNALFDLLIIGDGRMLESAQAVSDFEWAWMRLAPGGGAPEQLVLLGGSRLVLNGREIFSAAERVDYLAARLEGEELIIETEKRSSFNIYSFGARQAVLNGESFRSGKTGF